MSEDTISVYFINADMSGWREPIPVTKGTTVGQFFHQKLGQQEDPSRYRIRVNREHIDSNTVLNNGDTISVTPLKIEGAR